MTEPTARQYEVLRFVESFIAQNGYSPAIRDIVKFFGFSGVNAAMNHILALEKKGYIKRCSHVARSIVILKPTEQPNADNDPDAGGAGRTG